MKMLTSDSLCATMQKNAPAHVNLYFRWIRVRSMDTLYQFLTNIPAPAANKWNSSLLLKDSSSFIKKSLLTPGLESNMRGQITE